MRHSMIALALLAAFGSMTQASIAAPATKTPAAASAAAASQKSGVDLQWIDQSVRPQDDFYRFVSGKWLNSAEIPADRSRFGSFDELRDLSEKRSFEIIEGLAKEKHLKAGSNEQKIADLYNSFMDEATIEKKDIQPLLPVFKKIEALKDKQHLAGLMANLAKLGVGLPVQMGIGQDGKDSTKYAVYLSQGGLGLPDRDYYLDDKYKDSRDAYVSHITNMLTMRGDKKAAEHAQAIFALETEIARVQWDKVANRNPVKTYNKTEMSKLAEVMPGFDWKAFFTENGVGNKVDYVIIRQPDFLTKLSGVIAATPEETLKSYLEWRVLSAYAPLLSKRFVDEDFQFYGAKLRGVPENQPRWKRGVGRVEESLSEAVGKLYVEKHFPPEYKARMEKLVGNLITAYKESIETLDWMSPETKKEALTKLSKFTPKIGYPEVWRDYSKLEIKKGDLIGNVLRGREAGYQRQLAKLGKPIDRKEWGMSPQTVNAYYNSRMNEIVFPAAILQAPFFNPDADDAVNYGGIGAVIGHEISHGFDDSGSQSDGDGNLRDWWTAKDKENFGRLTSALVAQYEGYSPLPGYNVNGKLTLGENIADNSGLSIAYKAYKLSLGGKPSSTIDGFSGEQRVFIGWAQVWRGKARDKETIRLLATDPHSPAAVRGNAPLTNIQGFYDAFGVKESDKMFVAPEKRIKIW